MSNLATHFTPIALCEANGAITAPEYIQILPAGSFTPNDGRGPWNMADAEAVISATRSALGNLDMLLDYNHRSEHSARNGRPAPAAGWIKALEARPDGIYGRVEWTQKGADAVKSREFRYISPVFLHDNEGRVTRLVSCALTNTPALDMAALCERENITPKEERPEMDNKLLATTLGLPETATEAEIITACAEARKAQCEAIMDMEEEAVLELEATISDLRREIMKAVNPANWQKERLASLAAYLDELILAASDQTAETILEAIIGAGQASLENWNMMLSLG